MRKKQAKKRPLLPDPKFNDKLVTRFVNMLMWSGKKSIAFRIFYDAIEVVGADDDAAGADADEADDAAADDDDADDVDAECADDADNVGDGDNLNSP